MKTMACAVVGTLILSVHTAEPPTNEEWSAYIAEIEGLMTRVGMERMRSLVFTDGGGPSFSQRQQVNQLLKGRSAPAAVVTTNAFVRGIVTALAVFNPQIKAFRPEAVGEAFRYLNISETESKIVWRTVAKLQAELGIKAVRSTGI
jgi:hypothetical protein